MKTAQKPLRADAVRNRERVVSAARELFADQGRGVQMEDLARHAGVGIGTLYRHFPTKEKLVDAIATRRWEEIEAHLVADCGPDVEPFEAVRRMLFNAGEVQERDRLFCDVIEEVTGSAQPSGAAFARVFERTGEIVARGRAAGVLRPDLDAARMSGIFCGLAAVIRSGQDWRPYAEIVLDGLRAR
ncbi:MAG TPA: helix-turn-helix domain-containing protein [Solirubrobacteraceae bacterium]